MRQFAGGHANLTYLLRYGEGDELYDLDGDGTLDSADCGPTAPIDWTVTDE